MVYSCERCSWYNLGVFNWLTCCHHCSSSLPLFQVHHHTNRSWLVPHYTLTACLLCSLWLVVSVCLFVCLVSGNIGNVPLVLLAALCRDTSNPFGDSEKCSIDGTAYISFGQWVRFSTLSPLLSHSFYSVTLLFSCISVYEVGHCFIFLL